MPERKYFVPLGLAFLLYCVLILLRYLWGYGELPSGAELPRYLLYVVAAKSVFVSALMFLGYGAGGAAEFLRFLVHTAAAKSAFVAALMLAGYGAGSAAFRRWLPPFGSLLEEGLVTVALGLAVMSYALFVLGLIGALYPLTGYLLILASLGAGSRQTLGYLRRVAGLKWDLRPSVPLAALLFVCFVLLFRGLDGSLRPPSAFDVLMYHLGVPRLYLDAHGIFPTPDINGSYFPFGTEMLYLLGLMVDGPVAANLVNFSFCVMGGLAAAAFVRRFVAGQSGMLSFAMYISIPMVVWLMPQAYIEFSLALYTMLALHALLMSFREESPGWLVVAAALAGYTAAVKYTGLFAVGILCAGMAAHRLAVEKAGMRDTARRAGLFLAIAAAACAAWYVKNLVYYGNPVYPFFAGTGGYGVPTGAVSGGPGASLIKFVSSFWRTTFNAQAYQAGAANGFGPFFLMFLPGILLFRGVEREVKYLLVFCAVFYVPLITAENLRYYTAMFPALAVLAAYPVGRMLGGDRPARALGTALVAVFAVGALAASPSGEGVAELPSYDAQATDRYYSEGPWSGYLASYETWKWIDANLPPDAVVFQLWDDASVYFRKRKTLGSPFPFGRSGRQRVIYISGENGFGGYRPGEEIISNLKDAGAQYLLINANREGHALPEDPYFRAHASLVLQHQGVFLFQLSP